MPSCVKPVSFFLLLLNVYGILVLIYTLEPVWIRNLIKYVDDLTFDEIQTENEFLSGRHLSLANHSFVTWPNF